MKEYSYYQCFFFVFFNFIWDAVSCMRICNGFRMHPDVTPVCVIACVKLLGEVRGGDICKCDGLYHNCLAVEAFDCITTQGFFFGSSSKAPLRSGS